MDIMVNCEKYGHKYICEGRIELFHGNRCMGLILRRVRMINDVATTVYDVVSSSYGNKCISESELDTMYKYVRDTRIPSELKVGDTIGFSENPSKYMYMTVVEINSEWIVCNRPYFNIQKCGNSPVLGIEVVPISVLDTSPVYIFT